MYILLVHKWRDTVILRALRFQCKIVKYFVLSSHFHAAQQAWVIQSIAYFIYKYTHIRSTAEKKETLRSLNEPQHANDDIPLLFYYIGPFVHTQFEQHKIN